MSTLAGLALERALIFPTAFFLFGIYPLALLLLWTLLAYRQARHGHWLAAGLAGLLAGLTHVTILPLAAMLFVQAIQAFPNNHSWLRRLALLAVAALPVLGAALFLAWREFMGFPAITALQTDSWNRFISFPWTTLWVLVTGFPGLYLGNWVLFLNTAVLVVAVAAIIWGLRHLPLALTVYQVGLLLFVLSSGLTFDPLQSLDRYILAVFPVFFALASVARGRLGRVIYFAIGLLLSLGISAMFFMWKWIG